jgi:predicted alpha/beta-hydrolase family hydrolase
VTAKEHAAHRPILLLAHGAGAGQRSPWMTAWASRLSALGDVVPFEYAYMAAGKKRPDPLPVLVERHREALALARSRFGSDRPVVLLGKSMGSRVGCHLAVEESEQGARGTGAVRALVCFGYPLLGAARKDGSRAVRDEVLRRLRTPVLFLQGTRDPLCPLEQLEAVRLAVPAPTRLHVVPGGDHSLIVRKSDRVPQSEVDDALLESVRKFIASA